jgi:Acetyltransferase (GNAT) domain
MNSDEIIKPSEAQTHESIEISRKGRWVHVPAIYVDGRAVIVKGRIIKKAIIEGEEWQEREIDNPDEYVGRLKASRIPALRADIFTFSQKPSYVPPKYGYPKAWDSVAAIHLTQFSEWWDKLPQETRKNVRRAEKRGVTVTVRALDDDLIQQIMGVNNDSPVRQNQRFTHFGKSFDQVKKDQSSFEKRSDFICAYYQGELIGFVKLVYRGNVASILQILPRESHYDKRPANALIAKTVELCIAKKVEWLTYGMFNYGNKKSSALREFKSRNGFQELLVPRFYVPLTPWGSVCIRMGVHKGLLGILPPAAITVALRVRSAFYDLGFKISRCSSMLERSNRNRQMGRSNPPAGSNI